MRDRIVMQKLSPAHGHGAACGCGDEIELGELFYGYPVVDEPDMREFVCMTCHFWFVHEAAQDVA